MYRVLTSGKIRTGVVEDDGTCKYMLFSGRVLEILTLFRRLRTMVSGLLVLNAFVHLRHLHESPSGAYFPPYISTFASSSPSGIAADLIKHFHIGQEVATLLISLFVTGYCVGPLLWGPLSEQVLFLTISLVKAIRRLTPLYNSTVAFPFS
jgi:MFS family permease